MQSMYIFITVLATTQATQLNVLSFAPSERPRITSYSLATAPMTSFAAMDTSAPGETVHYKSAKGMTGYGMATGVSVVVQGPGAMAEAHFDMNIDAIMCSDIQKVMLDEYNSWTADQKSQVNKGWCNGSAGLDGLFSWLPFSVRFGGGYEHTDTHNEQTFESTKKANDMVQKVHDMTKQNLKVYGKVMAVGKSYLPIEASAWVRVMHIKYSDGSTQTVIDNPESSKAVKAADAHGSTSGVGTDPNGSALNVMHL